MPKVATKSPMPLAGKPARSVPTPRLGLKTGTKSKAAREDAPFLRLFTLFGCTFNSPNASGEAVADECPFCEKAGHFYLNVTAGQYKCHAGDCGRSGNAYTFIDWIYRHALETTTDQDYHRLRNLRGLPVQTWKRHGLAWYAPGRCWLVPYKSEASRVQNLTRYFEADGRKLALPGLPLRPYGLDQLSSDLDRLLFIPEGPFDAIALDHHLLANKTRARYDILAVPSAGVFRPEWLDYLKGRAVRLVFDNDKAGRDGQDRVAKLVREAKLDCRLSVLQWPDGFPEKCDIADLVRDGVNIVEFTRKHCVKVAAGERRILFIRGDAIPEQHREWFWQGHIPFGSFVSLSGLMGDGKSTVARDLTARATAGLLMPDGSRGLPRFDVLYFTSEDSAEVVRDLVRLAGGNLSRLHVHDIVTTTEPIDLLDCLEEIEAEIGARGARLVVVDALNSFVGGDISTDSRARRTLSGRLQALARRTAACILGIRNWGRRDGETGYVRVMGAASLSDVARCVMNTRQLEKGKFALEFEKVSDARKPKPIPYTVKDLSTGPDDAHLRKILWEKPVTEEEARAFVEGLRKRRGDGDKKGSKKGSRSMYTQGCSGERCEAKEGG